MCDVDLPTVLEDPVKDTAASWLGDQIRGWGAVLPFFLGFLMVRSALADPYYIPSGSMQPTLEIGDRVLVNKSAYGLRYPLTRVPVGSLEVPERGDVVVFVKPGTDHREDGSQGWGYWLDVGLPLGPSLHGVAYIKRVVGLPGEVIEVRRGVVYIDGKPQHRDAPVPVTVADRRCSVDSLLSSQEALGGAAHDVLHAPAYGAPDFGPEVVSADHVFVMGDNRDRSADSRSWGLVPLRNVKGRADRIIWSLDPCREPVAGIRSDRFWHPL